VDAGEKEAAGVLSTHEAFSVIDQIRTTGRPVVVLSGGEPLLRNDVYDIARYGTDQGLRMVMGTSGYLIDQDIAVKLRDSGIRAVAISLDSKNATRHDTFRGLDGVWERAVAAIGHCRDAGIGVQINMSVMQSAMSDVEDVIGLGTSLGVRDYQLFFPIPTGRARQIEPRSMEDYEDLIRQILIRYRDSDLNIRPTCAPQFRRIAAELGIQNPAWGRGCLAGITYCRIFANGDVTPCPYLPVSAGNVRTTPFSEIWNTSPLFTALRNPDLLTGKCGRCGFGTICGGCRARAYKREDTASPLWCDGLATPELLSGEVCGEDPWCPYQPSMVKQ
jgi:radical SAM protein with 4Fe4S-binding SPASM domain